MQENWVCCQLGAREHYAVPRALHQHGALDLLFTDAWIPPGHFLGRISPAMRRRFHSDLSTANVFAPNVVSLAQEVMARVGSLRAFRSSYWHMRLVRNRLFQKAATARLSRIPEGGPRRTVIAYSYMALEIFKLARARGWRTVLAQIDGGPKEDRIVAELYDNPLYSADLERPPEAYWFDWRQECEMADRIVVNSMWSQSALESESIPTEKLRVIPLAYDRPDIDASFEKTYPREFSRRRPLRVLFLGQINLRKGVAPLLEAARLLRNDPIEFWFVGPLHVTVPMDLRNEPHVHWTGAVSHADTAAYYREADVFVFPTFSDGFGLTQLEAQSWKLPIVTTRFCGEVVQNNINGWILPEVSAVAIVDVLRSCLSDPPRLQRFSANSSLSEHLTMWQLGKEWQHLFE